MLSQNSTLYLVSCPGLVPGNSVKSNVTLQNFLELPDTITLTRYKIIGNNSFTTDISYEILQKYNYLIFQNNLEGSRIWYAYIQEIDYSQIAFSTVKYDIDIITTFRGEIELPPPYVLRTHTREAYGQNYQPEPEICPLEYNYEYIDGMGYNTKKIALLATATPSGSGEPEIREYMINGQPFLGYFVNDLDVGSNVLKQYHKEGTEERIIKIIQYYTDTYSGSGIPNTRSQQYEKLDTIEGYTPINKKCLQYPFQSIIMSNNRGSQEEYNFRYFINDIAEFRYFWDGIIQNVGYAQPVDYVWSDDSISFVSTTPSIVLPYSNELSQTQYITESLSRIGVNTIANAPMNIASGVFSVSQQGGDINPLGMMYGMQNMFVEPLRQGINALMQARSNVRFGVPPNHNISTNQILNLMVERFSIYRKYCLSSIIKSYDSFFERYGYAVNRTISVNLNGGGNYTYFQFHGNAKIKATNEMNVNLNRLFEKGVTLWGNLTNIGVYAL